MTAIMKLILKEQEASVGPVKVDQLVLHNLSEGPAWARVFRFSEDWIG